MFFTEPIPDASNDLLEVYNVGSTICLQIDPVDATRNVPRQLARLRCADIGENDELNIPSPLPAAVVTWQHTDLMGNTAFFAINQPPDVIDDAGYMPPDEFVTTFFGLVGQESPFTVSTDAGMGASALDFSTNNITRDNMDQEYLNLRMAFGFWECTLNNSLGSQTERTLITDTCKYSSKCVIMVVLFFVYTIGGDSVPSITRNCAGIGELVPGTGVYLHDPKSTVPVVAGCDVCVPSKSSLALTITCPTNIQNFPGDSVDRYEWTDSNGNILSVYDELSVTVPGTYTCTVFFAESGRDSASSSVNCKSIVLVVCFHKIALFVFNSCTRCGNRSNTIERSCHI